MLLLFIDTLLHYCREHKFLIREFVVMPDHVHVLLTATVVPLERAIQFIKGGFSYRVKKELGLNMEIWERGYVDHRIRDAEDYIRHVVYVQENPVQAHLVERAEDYLCSSAHPGFELDPCPQGLKPEIARKA